MVPVFITMDLEIAYDHNIEDQRLALLRLKKYLRNININILIFGTADAFSVFKKEISLLLDDGHEIGCHGKSHGIEENYYKMNSELTRFYLTEATNQINNDIGTKPILFRGPYMTTSVATQQVLLDLGYIGDFSVCSGRILPICSQGYTLHWSYSPHFSYFPSEKSPFKKGSLPIVVIPLSCFVIPFVSGLLYMFDEQFMINLFNFFLMRASKTNIPIVYLFHSYEFARYIGNNNDTSALMKNRHIKQLHHYLYIDNPETRLWRNLNLFKYMSTNKKCRIGNVKKYVEAMLMYNKNSQLYCK